MEENIKYLRLACAPSKKANVIYKGIFMTVSLLIYITWIFIQEESIKQHRFLTILNSFFTTIVRITAFVEVIVSTREDSVFRRVVTCMQTVMYSFSSLVLLFYWAVLAKSTFSNPNYETYVYVYAVLNHLPQPLMSILPVYLERIVFKHWHFYAVLLPIALAYLIYAWIYAASHNHVGIYTPYFDFDNLLTPIMIFVALGIIIGCFYIGFYITRCLEKNRGAKDASSGESKGYEMPRQSGATNIESAGMQANGVEFY